MLAATSHAIMRQLLSTLFVSSFAVLSLAACAADSGPELQTVPGIEPISIEGQQRRGVGLTCPAGSTLCKTICCPTGSFCTTFDNGAELCQVPPIDPKLTAQTATAASDGGTKQPYLQVKLNDVLISNY